MAKTKQALINEQRDEISRLKAELCVNGYTATWHICRDDKIKPYPAVACSSCLPSDKVSQFNPFEELNLLRGIKGANG